MPGHTHTIMHTNHGGNLHKVASRYHIPVGEWLDLSTGIAPYSYPVPAIPDHAWRTLPNTYKPLIEAASNYYGTTSIMPVSGSQQAIELLPRCYQTIFGRSSRVWVPKQGYKEHEIAWRTAGFPISHYTSFPDSNELRQADIVVLINPNNPGGELFDRSALMTLLARVESLQGWMIVDEAFGDVVQREVSLASGLVSDRLFVLRSVGKFFGLAGIRLGFLCAHTAHIELFRSHLGPWSVNGPAQYIAAKALADTRWQDLQLERLQALSESLDTLLMQYCKTQPVGTSLFRTIYHTNASSLYHQLCLQGVYVRLSDEQDALRFGIPRSHELKRLEAALKQCCLNTALQYKQVAPEHPGNKAEQPW